jgi:NTE family protein
LSGTSAGAINAAVLASRAGHFRNAVHDMEQVWANFEVGQVFKSDAFSMLKSSLHWLVAIIFGGLGSHNPVSLLDSSPLRRLLTHNVHPERIEQALRRDQISALAVTASAYSTARSVTFFQTHEGQPAWSRARRIGRPARIGVDHLMASAAVPFIFPPVRIGGEYYGDGSMRHRSPLSAPIHLGADRLLVIGVRDEKQDPEPGLEEHLKPPSLAYLAGYMLDTLFLDGLNGDLERIARINELLDQIGPASVDSPARAFRHVSCTIVVPSRDIREIAAAHARELPLPLRSLLKGIGATTRDGRQLVSYLLFEAGFTRELIELGYADGMARRDDLKAFLFGSKDPGPAKLQ